MMISTKRWFTSDPEEHAMREKWHATKAIWEAEPCLETREAHELASGRLTNYIWNRACAQRDEDRRKHPKAKRNLPKEADATSNRAIP